MDGSTPSTMVSYAICVSPSRGRKRLRSNMRLPSRTSRKRSSDGEQPLTLFDNGLHHRIFEIPLNFRIRGLHQINGDHLLFWVHPEVRAEGAAPTVAAVGQHTVSRDGVADYTYAETKTLPARPALQRIRHV